MAVKSATLAILEAIRDGMRADPHLTLLSEYQRPAAVSRSGQVLDLTREFGPLRAPQYGPLDEEWLLGVGIGLAMSGVRAVVRLPSMTTLRAFELAFNQIGKARYMSGGRRGLPLTIWQDAAGRGAGAAGQHADAGQEALYAALPGMTVAVPSDAYNAKGLMAAALASPDPVILFHYGAINRVQVDVPDAPYLVEFGRAAPLQEGRDITVAGVAPATLEMVSAARDLAAAGISAELIDLRSLKPLDTDTLLASVRKTGRFLAVDHGHETMGLAAELVARVAIGVPGARVARITFPDAPSPPASEMIAWMTPDAARIVAAAQRLVSA